VILSRNHSEKFAEILINIVSSEISEDLLSKKI